MTNEEHLNRWLHELRTTTAQQTNSVLASGEDSDHLAFCCLGIGCQVAGLGLEAEYPDEEESDGEEVTWRFDGCQDLPPSDFHAWLGLYTEDEAYGHGAEDVYLDWPDAHYLRREHGRAGQALVDGGKPMDWTCAGLNDDAHLTFPQIADMIAYFGIKAEPRS